jgi:hypothetical protein
MLLSHLFSKKIQSNSQYCKRKKLYIISDFLRVNRLKFRLSINRLKFVRPLILTGSGSLLCCPAASLLPRPGALGNLAVVLVSCFFLFQNLYGFGHVRLARRIKIKEKLDKIKQGEVARLS